MKRNLVYLLVILSVSLPLILGSLSIRPFTKLYLPWMMFEQWRRVQYPAPNDDSCIEKLRQNVAKFELTSLPASDIEMGCMIDSAVVVSHLTLKLTNIAYPPQENFVALSCEFANILQSFIDQKVIPLSKELFTVKPIAFLHKGGYSCRGQREFTEIKSEHAFAQAIDFAGIRFDDGTDILVERDFGQDSPAGRFLDRMFSEGCEFFGTSLGPKLNELHKDHYHWSIGFPKICL